LQTATRVRRNNNSRATIKETIPEAHPSTHATNRTPSHCASRNNPAVHTRCRSGRSHPSATRGFAATPWRKRRWKCRSTHISNPRRALPETNLGVGAELWWPARAVDSNSRFGRQSWVRGRCGRPIRYPDWPLLEDIEMLRRLRPHGRVAVTTVAASTSGRRWLARGVWSTLWLNQQILLGYYRGVPVEQSAQRYSASQRGLRQTAGSRRQGSDSVGDRRMDSGATVHPG
jgi:hypothetical protein